jgi:transposase
MIDHYLGVDLHGKRSYLVLMTAEGAIEDKRRLSNSEVTDYIKGIPRNTHAVLEATGNWSYMYDLLAQRLDQVDLAHPQQVRAIATARIKNDRIDATILAHLTRTNLLPRAYAAALPIRELRDATRHRSRLVRERTRHKNRIHRILSRYNLHSPYTDLFGKKGNEWLAEQIPVLSQIHQQMTGDYLAIIDALNQRIKAADQTIHAWSKTDPRAALLMSMPGIGVYSAAIIVAEIAEIRRFHRAKELCSFAGLVPSTRSSDSNTYHGRITKQGSSWLRWIMISASQRAGSRSPRLKAFYDRIAQKHGGKTARVALARKMLSIVFFMLSRQQPFIEEYQQA